MEIKQTTKTDISLTSEDVEQIVKEYLESKGYTIESIYAKTKVVYEDMGEWSSTKFDGFNIVADKLVQTKDI